MTHPARYGKWGTVFAVTLVALLVFCGIVVLMRWLVIGLLVSVAALLCVAGAVAWHVWRQRRMLTAEADNLDAQKQQHLELNRALDLDGPAKPKDPAIEQIP